MVVLFMIPLIFAGCASPRVGFEQSYREAVAAEDQIGRQIFAIGSTSDDILVGNYIAAICDQTRAANTHLYDSFRLYEQSIAAGPTKSDLIREDVLTLARKHGAVLPVVRPIPDHSLVQPPRYTFPWAPYLSPAEYIKFVESNNIRKSEAARKAWKMLNPRSNQAPAKPASR
jgi:hypothetical protein